MNVTTLIKTPISARFFAGITIVALLLSAFPAAFFVAEAAADKIDICHWNEGEGGRFIVQSSNKTADAGGHAGHHDGQDIIPAFDYPAQGNQPAGTFPGQNLTTDYNGFTGAEVLAAGCETEINGSIAGAKYNDVDNDGSISGDETIAGWTIRLYEVEGEWVLASTTVTDGDGEYVFNDLSEGAYKVCEVMQADWTQTFVTNGTANLSPNASEEGPECRTVNIDDLADYNNTVNFGNYYEETVEKETEYIVVTGDTIDLNTGMGWMFNRDTTTATPFEFDDDQAVLGEGALYVFPIANTYTEAGKEGNDKFIGEYFAKLPVEDFESFSYDFFVESLGATDYKQFYLNVYINIDDSNNYYDCRFDFVPDSGNAGEWTSVTFDADDVADNVRLRGTRIGACPATIGEMPAGSYISFFAISLGDTSLNDQDDSGYFDNVVLDTVSKTTTFDFEPEEEIIPGCTNETATNYDPEANEDDGSCTFPFVSQCIDVNQNLLTNGSFEEPEVTNSSKWQKMASVPGWDVTKVSDSTPTTLELMKGIFGNNAADGLQYAELDGDQSTLVTQAVSGLEVGATYELAWSFAGRHNVAAEQNQLDVMIDGSSVATAGPQTNASGLDADDWTRSSVTFVAGAETASVSFADAGPSNTSGTYLDDAQLCLVEEAPALITVSASKIVCDFEDELPNWGKKNNGNPGVITETTATDWLAANTDTTCRLVEDWDFQWSDRSVSAPSQYNKFLGEATGWNTFSGSAQVDLADLNGGPIEFREVLPETDDYLSFSGGNDTKPSAELYCGNDVLNYDNLERVNKPVEGETYHCVAWNVPKVPPQCELDIYSDTTTVVLETNETAVETYTHNSWTDNIANAVWIWITEQVTDPEVEEMVTFVETFTVDNPTLANITIAHDNWLTLNVNGTEFVREQNGFRDFQILEQDILAELVSGENRIEMTVTNLGVDRSNFKTNPAGALFHIEVEGDPQSCARTTEPVPAATLEITNPAVPDMILSGVYNFTAEYNDDDEEVDLIQWAIRAGTCAASTGTVAGNVDGFSDGWMFVGNEFEAEVDMSGWANGDYCFVVNPREQAGEENLRATQTFILNNPTDPEPETYRISGYKYLAGEELSGLAGWEIELRNNEGVLATTSTDGSGYYFFDVASGSYEVHEVMQPNWIQTDVVAVGGTTSVDLDTNHCVFDVSSGLEEFAFAENQAITQYSCEFTNQFVPEDENVDPEPETRTSTLSTGTRTNRSFGSAPAPAPLVLGVSTDQCPFLTDHMQMGWENDRMEVMKLQLFLHIFKDLYGGTDNPVTGNFGIITDTNVKTFQAFYRNEVLTPWFEEGIVGHEKPTGFVYKTTLWKINDIVCGAAFPSLEGETLENNVDLNARAVQD